MNCAGYAGAVYQYLEDGALLTVSGHNHDGKLGHTLCLFQLPRFQRQSALCFCYFPEGFFPSNFPLSIKGCGFLGPGGDSVLGETRCTVHRTISSE